VLAVTVTVTVAVAVAAPVAGVPLVGPQAAAAAAKTPAETAFIKAYTALVPSLNKVSGAIIKDTQDAGKLTDAQVVTVFTGLARQWKAATAPFIKLKPPAAYAAAFAAAAGHVAPIGRDLLATANVGRTHSTTAGTQAGRRLVLDFNALGVAITKLKKLLGLP
jgi:hypothetical protein